MERKQFSKKFSQRLVDAMRKEGHEINRVGLGLNINKLAEVTGCSYQMARKYTIGLALPELYLLTKIAKWLKTSPSWLLFGEDDSQHSTPKTAAFIEIDPNLLKYILNKCIVLFSLTENQDDVISFIVDTIYDTSHINTDAETIHKIIDMMVASATLFNHSTMDSEKTCSKSA